ncbi:hypothetical protein, partial [Mesorhizobium marinum]|uniref:hypothetical protein n=1 Tax=Mesorhizobium marinum TaxID=3228790 RepID=UPI003466F643
GASPFDDLTDEELEAAINSLNQHIADTLGVTPEEAVSAAYVDVPVEMSDEQLRALAARIKGGSLG